MIVLIGFMGAGKSTVGRLLGQRLNMPFVDSDAVIEEESGRAIAEIFDTSGEAGFRDIEEDVIGRLLTGPPSVVSLGGGACGRVATRARLAGHTVVYLAVDLAEARRRVGTGGGRPLARGAGLEELYAGRLRQYEECATISCDTTGRTPEDIVDDIATALREDDQP